MILCAKCDNFIKGIACLRLKCEKLEKHEKIRIMTKITKSPNDKW